jgi:superoxide dismutase
MLTFEPSSPSPLGTNQGLFNNAAQSWNHAFYWDCMKPNGGGVATGKVAALIDKQFGSFDKFRAEFVAAGKSNCLTNNIITLKMTQLENDECKGDN